MKRSLTFTAEDGTKFDDMASCKRYERKAIFIKEYDERQDGQLWAGESAVSGAALVEWLTENNDIIFKMLTPPAPVKRTPAAGAVAGAADAQ